MKAFIHLIFKMDACIHLLILAILVTHTASQESQCPRESDVTCNEGKYPIQGNCASYCQVSTVSCETPGYHFNPYEGTCEKPEDARCDHQYITGTLFCAAGNNRIVNGPQDTVPFNNILANFENPFHDASSTVLTATEGDYFFHLAAGAGEDSPIDYRLDGMPDVIGVYSDSTDHGSDVQTRDFISHGYAASTLRMSIEEGTSLNTDLSLWAGFSLQEFMEPEVVAFSAVRTSDLALDPFPNDDPKDIVFDKVVVNSGNDYSSSTGKFTTPVAGTYLFSFSSAASRDRRFECQLRSDMWGELSSVWRGIRADSAHTDTLSKSVLVELRQNENISMSLMEGEVQANNDIGLNLLSFSGFLYKPSNGTTKTMWMAHRTFPADAIDGDLDLVFNDPDLAFLPPYFNGREVTAPYSGYYFVTMTGGTPNNATLDMRLVHTDANSVETDIMRIYRTINNEPYTDTDTIGRTAIIYMNADDMLKVTLKASTKMYSNEKIASFGGFLLKEITL